MFFRATFGLDATSFIGSAIATAGLSFLLPLTKPKDIADKVSIKIMKAIENSGGKIISKRDNQFIPIVWICILIGFIVWFIASHIALKEPTARFIFLPKHVAIGFINYLLAAILTAIKNNL